MAEAELLILPEMSMVELKQAMGRLDDAMKKAAKKAGDEFEDELEKGIIGGAKRGFRRAAAAARSGFDKMGGGRGIAGGIIAGLGAGFMANIQRADEATALLEGAATQSQARVLMGGADLTRLDAASMSKMWNMAQRAGFDDARDFVDILTNIGLKVTEAETGEDPLMNQFKGLRGVELYEAVLGSIAKADPALQAYFLDKLEAGERLPEMSAFLKDLVAQGGGQLPTNWLSQMTDADADRALALMTEEKAITDFQAGKVASDAERQAAIMAALPDKMAAYFTEQRRITAEQMTLISTYEENLSAAIPMREAVNEALTMMAGTTAEILNEFKTIKAAYQDRGVMGALEVLNGGRNIITNKER